MKKKRAFTLLEIMIVIFLIGLIGSVIGYNMKGSLDEGKAFKTKHAKIKIKDILELEMARGVNPEDIVDHPEKFLKASGVVTNPGKMLLDGWGQKFEISLKDDGTLRVFSKKHDSWTRGKTQIRGKDLEDQE
ncbi:MAG: Type II secretion system protein G [Chlamydiae bacterium]|nr:Type II secretion system protein G [Chlamydiota bacterium]